MPTLVMLVPRLRCRVETCRRPPSRVVLRNRYPAALGGPRICRGGVGMKPTELTSVQFGSQAMGLGPRFKPFCAMNFPPSIGTSENEVIESGETLLGSKKSLKRSIFDELFFTLSLV